MWQEKGYANPCRFLVKTVDTRQKRLHAKKLLVMETAHLTLMLDPLMHPYRFAREGFAKFCGSMDLPPPILSKSYYNNIKEMKVKSAELAENMMKETVNRLIALQVADGVDIKIDSNGVQIACVPVTLDGTWQKRGHASKHGVVYILSVDTGECLDYSVKTLHCHECINHQNDDKKTDMYLWHKSHLGNCLVNYHGSSGGMEAKAGVEMFLKSIETRNLKYTTFVGDGDSSCYSKVRDACTARYGESYPVIKEECTEHVQKRMGAGLHELKRKRRGQKLSDGKSLGGAGRLTEGMMERIQCNYGEAIRNNSTVELMTKAIK